MTKFDINLDEPSNLRQAANKKNKKAQKAADRERWLGSGDEAGNKEGGDGGDENGGGSNNGDGGAGDDGGGGDEWNNNWATGKKKKTKKAKEEEKKKKEEEEEEENQKAEEAKDDPLSWANDEGDNMGDFAITTKDKKKKKDKVGDFGDE